MKICHVMTPFSSLRSVLLQVNARYCWLNSTLYLTKSRIKNCSAIKGMAPPTFHNAGGTGPGSVYELIFNLDVHGADLNTYSKLYEKARNTF